MREHIRIGDSREFFVAADLTSKGFEVYLGHGKSSFDMVAYKDGELLRIEVKGPKKGRIPTGPVYEVSRKGNRNARLYDVLATVVDGAVLYNRSGFTNYTPPLLELCGVDQTSKFTAKRFLQKREEVGQ